MTIEQFMKAEILQDEMIMINDSIKRWKEKTYPVNTTYRHIPKQLIDDFTDSCVKVLYAKKNVLEKEFSEI